MARKQQTKGICCLCGSSVGKAAMTKHLLECNAKHTAEKKTQPAYMIRAEFPYDKRYWLTFDASVTASFSAIDSLLRNAWLECCGHMSEFSIAGKQSKLEQVLEVGTIFAYEYDFGSTTDVLLTVLATHEAPVSKKATRLLSYNTPLEIPCAECGEPAIEICSECYSEEGMPQAYCKTHLKQHIKVEHDNDDYSMMPIINSPRAGVCGYDGPGPEAYAKTQGKP
jgi:hypothetical protein